MPREITIPSYGGCHFRELWEIKSWKDGYVWEVEPIGFIREQDSHIMDRKKYELSSISTHRLQGDSITLNVFTRHELEQMMGID